MTEILNYRVFVFWSMKLYKQNKIKNEMLLCSSIYFVLWRVLTQVIYVYTLIKHSLLYILVFSTRSHNKTYGLTIMIF